MNQRGETFFFPKSLRRGERLQHCDVCNAKLATIKSAILPSLSWKKEGDEHSGGKWTAVLPDGYRRKKTSVVEDLRPEKCFNK